MNVKRRTVVQSLSAGLMVAPQNTLQKSPQISPQEGPQSGPKAAPIRVGQIGSRHAHANKLAVYRESPDYDVVGLVEPDPARRQELPRMAAFRDVPLLTEEQLLNTD